MSATRPTRAERLAILKTDIARALLTGRQIRWGMCQHKAWRRLLEENGIQMVSRTQAARRKLEVLPDAKAPLVAYFGAPIQRYTHLFLVACQTQPIPKPEPLFDGRGGAS